MCTGVLSYFASFYKNILKIFFTSQAKCENVPVFSCHIELFRFSPAWSHMTRVLFLPPLTPVCAQHPGDRGRACAPLRAARPAAFCTKPPSLLRQGENSQKATDMSASSAFNDEKGGSSSVGEPEYGHDPASGGIFSTDYKRYRATCCFISHIVVGVYKSGGGAACMLFPVR